MDKELALLDLLEDEIDKINEVLKEDRSSLTLDGCMEYLCTLNSYKARTGEMLAQAICIATKMKSRATDQFARENPKASANHQKAYVDGCCADATRVVDKIERANKSCTLQSDNFRTIVSTGKEEMSLSRKGY